MDMTKNYLVQGFIDARDERQGALSILLLAVATRRDLLSIDILVSDGAINKGLSWEEMLPILRAPKAPDRPPQYEKIENDLKDFIDLGRHLQNIAKNRNTKPVEQAISRYCGDHFHLKAVTFLNSTEISSDALALILEKKESEEPKNKPKTGGKKEETDTDTDTGTETEAETAGEEKKELQGIFIRCEPLLDPVHGIAMMDLHPGDVVFATLPADSVFYKLFLNQFPQFDGTINAEITGIVHNDTGSATVSMNIAEDISGLMKLTGRVRIKVLRRWNENKDGDPNGKSPPAPGRFAMGKDEWLFGIIGGLMLLVLFWLMFSVLN